MRLRPVVLDGLHVPIHYVACIDHCQLRKEEAELLVVSARKTRLHVGWKIPETFLERTKGFLAGLVKELLVGIGWLALVLRVLS